MPRATIKDVALRAGVSTTTVSHVINDTRFVEEQTRQLVLDAIRHLNYRPSMIARSLTTNRTGTVGIIASDVTNYFFAEIIRGAEDVLGPSSYGLIVCNLDEKPEREIHYLELLLRQRVDGIIAAAATTRWHDFGLIEAQGTPIVFVDRTFDGMNSPFVGVDNFGGAYEATSHLLSAGHRRIGVVTGFRSLSTMRERLAGADQALDEQHLELRRDWMVECPQDAAYGRQAVVTLLSEPDHPRAIFATTNVMTLATLAAIRDLGLRCPQDIALIGFDDHPWAEVTNPAISVVRQPSRELGRVAARMLCSRINNEPVEQSTTMLSCELVLRGSCCPFHSQGE
jgi:DNA-binding LacI/PurR family transcriptional regulator